MFYSLTKNSGQSTVDLEKLIEIFLSSCNNIINLFRILIEMISSKARLFLANA